MAVALGVTVYARPQYDVYGVSTQGDILREMEGQVSSVGTCWARHEYSRVGDFVIAETGHQMVVDQAGGLHDGVDDGGADEFEAAFEQVLAQDFGRLGLGGDLLHR